MIRLKRYSDNPIMERNIHSRWEQGGCFNAAVVDVDGTVHMFYRTTDKNSNGRECKDYCSYIGHAVSQDGIHFTKDPDYVLGPRPDSQYIRGCEDPRITLLDSRYYMLYTGYGARFSGDYRICMASSDDLVHWEEHGIVLDESNKDAALFPAKVDGQYMLLHRRAPHIWIARSDDLQSWHDHQILAKTHPDHPWEDCKIGIGGQPMLTEHGYILIYHGVSKAEKPFEGRGSYKQYALGIMLLDRDDPTKMIYRQEEPILVPELAWELSEGYVPNVVFSCGQIIRDDTLYVYYAGSDSAIGLATCSMQEINQYFE